MILVVSAIVILCAVILSALVGVIHDVAGWSTVDHSGAGAANVAALQQGGDSVGSEIDIQRREGTLPTLIGVDCIEDIAGAGAEAAHVKVLLNNWRSSDYVHILARNLTTGIRVMDPYKAIGAPWVASEVADWNVTYTSTGGVDHGWLLRLSYGAPIAPIGGKVIWRRVTGTAADYSTTGAFGTAATVSDLNPDVVYRIYGIGGYGGTACGIVRIKAPSFNGRCMQALLAQGRFSMDLYPWDSCLVSGRETLSVAFSGGAASACVAMIGFEEYMAAPGAAAPPPAGNVGGTASGSTASGGSGQSLAVAPRQGTVSAAVNSITSGLKMYAKR